MSLELLLHHVEFIDANDFLTLQMNWNWKGFLVWIILKNEYVFS